MRGLYGRSCLIFFYRSLSSVTRISLLEEKLQKEHCSEEKKSRQLISLGKKESQYLRLRRTRLSIQDFQTVKVIGKGAFGLVTINIDIYIYEPIIEAKIMFLMMSLIMIRSAWFKLVIQERYMQ